MSIDTMGRGGSAIARSGHLADGCLTLANNGGNDFSVRVVTGAETGRIWRTGERDLPESPRLYDPDAADDPPLDFDGWLGWWADGFFGLRLARADGA